MPKSETRLPYSQLLTSIPALNTWVNMEAIYSLFRLRALNPHNPFKHSSLPQHDPNHDPENENDTTILLHSPSPSLQEKNHLTQSQHDIRIAIKTLLLSTLVYATLGTWLIWSMHGIRIRDPVHDLDDMCMDKIARYSPVLQDVKPGWHDVLFNGSFLHENVFRGPAGEGTDRAWEELGVNYRSVVVPEEDAEASGIRHDQVKISQFYGGGFPANVQGLHHLHCLDLLRKALHWNYDHYKAEGKGAFTNSEYIVRVHTTHCLDILRQVLMCTPDVGVLGQVWWQPQDEPHPLVFVDFMTTHRCRDYEAIRVWAEKHQLPLEEDVDMSRFYEMPGPGDTIYPAIP